MSVSAQETVFQHVGNGATVTFAYGCQVAQAADLKVYLNDVEVTSGFSVSGIGVPTGGSVTFDAPPASLAQVRLERDIVLERVTDYQQNGDFLARVVNPDFNRLWMALQQHLTILGRALLAPKSDATGPTTLPIIAERANKLLSFDENGNPVAVVPVAQSASAVQIQLAASSGSSLVGWIQSGVGAVFRWVRDKLRESLSVKDFGAVGDGVTNDTAAIQAAIAFGVLTKRRVFVPAGTYLVTDTISIPVGTQLCGETGYQYTNGFGTDPKATTIIFQPTAEKSLFVANGASYAGFRFHYAIGGLYIKGNSASAVGFSKYAFDLDGVIYGRFENIGIEGFQTGIRCSATINNRFVNVYTTGKIQTVLYAGNNETTDVWDQCSFWGAPVGVTGAGSSLSIRFNHCLFEQLDNYGVNLARECQSWMFDHCYAEDVPYTNNAAGAMFKIGTLGVALVAQNHLQVIGGTYNGRNAGAVGSLVDTDYCNGVILQGITHNRFTQIIKTSANTRANSIVVTGGAGVGYTTYATDVTKLSGVYPNGVINSGSNAQMARLSEVDTDLIAALSGGTSINLSGGALQFAIGAANAAWPTVDNTKSLGIGSNRWSTIYAGTATINTSDEMEKQRIGQIEAAALRAWAKVEFCQFKFNDAVAAKGDGARWHFGVIAQRVKEAFESEGLDAFAYGVLCFDKWDAADAVLDAEGQIVTPAREADERYGIRYEEALVLECAYLRSRLPA